MAEVLVIDDCDHDAELTLQSLQRCNPSLSMFRLKDGQQALEYLLRTGAFAARSSKDPDLILCDVQMPHLNGLDFVEAVKSHRELSYVPIVLFSGSDNPLLRERALIAGAQRFLSKPAEFEAYCARIRTIAHQWLDCDDSGNEPKGLSEKAGPRVKSARQTRCLASAEQVEDAGDEIRLFEWL
jgi:CheY-like chemotaxis protein